MSHLRTRLSAVVVWGMMPLAAWAGAPSSGCLCASGQFKLFCGHDHHATQDDTLHDTDCCGAEHASEAHFQPCIVEVESPGSSHAGDCCQHGATSPADGVRGRSACQPILNALSMISAPVSPPGDDAPTIAVQIVEPPAVASLNRAAEAVDFDTGPPHDRVVAFRHLLI